MLVQSRVETSWSHEEIDKMKGPPTGVKCATDVWTSKIMSKHRRSDSCWEEYV